MIMLSGKCGHHFDDDCPTCNRTQEVADAEIMRLHKELKALESRLSELNRLEDVVSSFIPVIEVIIDDPTQGPLVEESLRSMLKLYKKTINDDT